MYRLMIVLSAVLPMFSASLVRAEKIYGLTNLQELVSFDSDTRSATTVPLDGFSVGSKNFLSIDVRPSTGALYGLSSDNTLYEINPTTGQTTAVGGPIAGLSTNTGRSIDFNPTVDLLRVVSTSGENLRVNPTTGAVVGTDTNLAFAAGDSNAGGTPNIASLGYTNSVAGASSTVLYDIDTTTESLLTQNPANSGQLTTVGSLGLDLGFFSGFDISGTTGNAYLVGTNIFGTPPSGIEATSLYSVNLATGAASLLGPVSGINFQFRDIAVSARIPEPASFVMAATGFAVLLGLGCRRKTTR